MRLLRGCLSLCSLLVLISSSVSENCIQKNPCRCVFSNKTAIDLTSISRSGSPRFFEILGDDNATKPFNRYSYDPCHSFSYDVKSHETEKNAQACVNAAACVVTPGDNTGGLPKQKLLGSLNSATFYMGMNEIVYINYSAIENHKKIILTVQLVCDISSLENARLDVTNETSMVLTTRCACADACSEPDEPAKHKDKLSTGSILLITFFVIVLVYLGLGILWNFCNGAQSTELLPNIEFWSDLPKLIMDGCRFTCSCFGRKQSYTDM